MAQQASSLLSEAQQDFVAGRLDEAKLKFEMVLNRDPKNVAARNYLRMIEAAKRKVPGVQREAAFRAVVLPKVEFGNARLSECLNHLHKQVEELTGGKLSPNFVITPGVNSEAPVTLSLSNIPFTELLKYIGQQTGTRFVYEAHAISVLTREEGRSTAKAASSARVISE